MNPHILLTIGDDGVIVTPHNIPDAAAFFMPTENRQAAQEILNFIARYPKARLTLCADNLAQDYRCDTIPPLTIIDRAKVLNRRLKQMFPSARLTAFLRAKKSRDQVLMIGLHDSNQIFAWAHKLRARLPSLALLPVEGARVAATLMPEAATGWAMMISRQKSGGLRQIVTFKNDLVFTRLTPLPAHSDDEAEVIARDIKASLDYLTRQGLRDAKNLAVLLLLPDDIHTAKAFKNLSLQSLRSLSPFAAAQKLALPFAPQQSDSEADLLFAAHILTRRPALSLMLPDIKKNWCNQTLHRWGMRVAIVTLTLACANTLWRMGDVVTQWYQTQKAAIEEQTSRDTLAKAQANAAPITQPLGRLRQALERKRLYEQPTPLPWHGLNALAQRDTSLAQITALHWQASPETFALTLRIAGDTQDRAATVTAFTLAAQNIAQAAPDYTMEIIHPPYPALPQEAVSAESATSAEPPSGDIVLYRKPHD